MNRLESMITADVQLISEDLLKLLENEITYAVKNFITLSNGVRVRYIKKDGKVKFMAEFDADSIRPLGFIPKRGF